MVTDEQVESLIGNISELQKQVFLGKIKIPFVLLTNTQFLDMIFAKFSLQDIRTIFHYNFLRKSPENCTEIYSAFSKYITTIEELKTLIVVPNQTL